MYEIKQYIVFLAQDMNISVFSNEYGKGTI